ncbi:MAG TPA: hypothetical protein VF808_03280 [Ktedonobacterales bacterium]
MLLRDAPAVGLALAFLLAPGIIWALLAYPSPSRVIRLGQGLALGLAAQVTMAGLLAATAAITPASVTVSTLLALVAAIALGTRMRVRAPRPASRAAGRWRESLWLGAVTAAGVAICAAPLARWSIPDGWDPSAHALLAGVVIATGKLPTWWPFDPIASNYPYGAHVLLADISMLTGVTPERVFGPLLNIFAPALVAPQVYALARRMWRRGAAAVAAVAAYGLLGFANSVAYGAWGGLPNALGLILLLALLEPLLAPGYTRRRVALAGFLLSATTLTHHHVTLTAALILGAYGAALAALLVARPSWAPAATRAIARRSLLRTLAVCGLGMLLASYEFAPYLIRGASSLGDTGVFADFHEYSGWPFDKNGVVLWLAATAGAVLALWSAWRRAPGERGESGGWRAWLRRVAWRLSPRSAAGLATLLSAVALVGLFVAFVFGQFVFKDIEWALYHRDATAFSPPRFLSNMTYFLALFAGPALAWVWDASVLGVLRARPHVAWAGRALARGALVAGTLAVGLTSLYASGQMSAGAGTLAPGDAAAFAWVRTHTPANTIVIALLPNDAKWAPYFTWRESFYTPLPASENATDYVVEKPTIIAAQLEALSAHPRLGMVALASAGDTWPYLDGRPVAVITRAATPYLGVPAFTSSGAWVYVRSSLAALAPAHVAASPVSLFWRMSASGAPPTGWYETRGAATLGWISGQGGLVAPEGARWLIMRIDGPLPAGASVICQSEQGAQLWVDGVLQRRACYGEVTAMPALSAPGPHIIAVYLWHGADPQPWGDVLLLAPLSA